MIIQLSDVLTTQVSFVDHRKSPSHKKALSIFGSKLATSLEMIGKLLLSMKIFDCDSAILRRLQVNEYSQNTVE